MCEIGASLGFFGFSRLRAHVACVLVLKSVYYSSMKHGGARPGSGRKTELNGQPVRRVNVTLDERTVKLLLVLGNGNLSKGVRQSAEVAYDQYLKSG